VSFILYLIILFFWGLVIGAFARLALPGKDPMSIPMTALLGIAGSVIAGVIVWLISDGAAGAGFLASLVVTVLILYFIRRSRGGGLTDPGRVDGR
jgi:uncharacterized membrane protein YeaQ/YmgE (transglycosylase-associated protein family)